MTKVFSTISMLWLDVRVAVENKKQNPERFNRYYIGQIDDSPSAPIHHRKCQPRSVIEKREDHFSLNGVLQGVILTRRETQVLYLICHGDTNREVAFRLGLSPRTAEYYIKNMRKKAVAVSKAHLIQLVTQTDFLTRVNKTILKNIETDAIINVVN